jgi:hypothetical protein
VPALHSQTADSRYDSALLDCSRMEQTLANRGLSL